MADVFDGLSRLAVNAVQQQLEHSGVAQRAGGYTSRTGGKAPADYITDAVSVGIIGVRTEQVGTDGIGDAFAFGASAGIAACAWWKRVGVARGRICLAGFYRC